MKKPLWIQMSIVSTILIILAFAGVDLSTQVVPWVSALTVIALIAAGIKYLQAQPVPARVQQQPLSGARRRNDGTIYRPSAKVIGKNGKEKEVICELVR